MRTELECENWRLEFSWKQKSAMRAINLYDQIH
jgi:hypothetical protein